METHSQQAQSTIRWDLISGVLIFLGSLIAFLSIGEGGPTIDRVLTVLHITITSGWIPGIYLISSFGIGFLFRRLIPQSETRWVIQLGIGLSILLSVSQLMGLFGLLDPVFAWILLIPGFVLCINELLRSSNNRSFSFKPGPFVFLSSFPWMIFGGLSAMVLAMCCNPPGIAWSSEAGGYDSLSYHLELPRQWLELGRVWPIEHNVYSYLPGYFESAYVHMGLLVSADSLSENQLSGLLSNHGQAVMGIRLFSGFLSVISAFAMGSLVSRISKILFTFQSVEHRDRLIGFTRSWSSVLLLATPWILAIGTMSYNEIGVVFLGISAWALTIERDWDSIKRVILLGVVIGGACSCKPTAGILLAPSIAIVFLTTFPMKQMIKVIPIGGIVFAIMLSPWLIRNGIASGNPIFPHASSIFGNGPWTPDQHEIYALAHHFDGSILDRFRLLILPDEHGIHHTSKFRGFTNLYWGITPIVGLIGLIVMLIITPLRKHGLILLLALSVSIFGWLFLTHLQSRFLIPMIPMLIGFGAIGLGVLSIRFDELILVKLIAPLIIICACTWSVQLSISQLHNHPFVSMLGGTDIMSDRGDIDSPVWWAQVNSLAHDDETIYLFGDASSFYIRSPVIVNTVYDRWLIHEAINQYADNPERWTEHLNDEGVDLIIVGFSEIKRFYNTGWLPKEFELQLIQDWIYSLGEPIYVWTNPYDQSPIRMMFRINQ